MATRFSFPPRSSRGSLMGFTLGQLICCAAAVGCLVLALNLGVRGHAVVAIGSMVAAAGLFAVGLLRVRGRRATEWLPILVAALVQRAGHQDRFRGGPFAAGRGDAMELPGPLAGYTWISGIAPDGETEIGLLKHRVENTVTAVLACGGQNFILADTTIQDRRLHDWANALNTLGVEYGERGLTRWSITTRAVPDTGNRAQRFLINRATDTHTEAYESLAELTANAAPTSQRQEMYMAFVFDLSQMASDIEGLGGTDEAVAALIIEQLFGIEATVAEADIKTYGWLSPRSLAAVLRTQFDPADTAMVDLRAHDKQYAGVSPRMAGPIAAENVEWDYYRHDSAYSQTLWVYEMPRQEMPSTWLTPVFTQTTCRRTVTLTAQPVPAAMANLAARRDKVARAGDDHTKRKLRLVRTAKDDIEAQSLEQTDREQAAGHVRYRYVLLVTVTASSLEQLKRDVLQVKRKLAAARVEPVLLYGEQDQGFFAGALPLGRGLKPLRGLFS